MELAQYDNALKAYNTSLKIKPKSEIVLYSKGRLYHAQGQKERALQYYNEVYRINPNHKLNLIAIGNIYSDFGDKNKACKYYDLVFDKKCNSCTPKEINYLIEKTQ